MIGDKVIEDFPVMLASPQKFLDRIKFPAIVQEKMDGMRCNIIKRKGHVYVYSRNGKLMDMHGRFKSFLHQTVDDVVLDGELLVYGAKSELLDRKTGNGILHKAVVGTISSEETRQVMASVWDAIPYEHWIRGECDIPYDKRFVALVDMVQGWSQGHPVSIKVVNNIEEAEKYYHYILSVGGEGIILKNIKHPWEDKRSRNCVKMKPVSEIDLKIVDVIEGEGKYTGMFGKFICENKDRTISVGVGTGYSDQQREDFWKIRKELIGKICAVKYNTMITRKDKDIKSLFLPVFVEIRYDKDTSD